jgi:hypothetical protein
MIEVELKVKIPSPGPVREQLDTKHAEFMGKVHEHDIFYNAPHRDFGVTDEAVRVRYTGDRAVVTYKGPKIKKFGLKAREELNFGVESGGTFETMLLRLGFTKTAEVNKWRKTTGSGMPLSRLTMSTGWVPLPRLRLSRRAIPITLRCRLRRLQRRLGWKENRSSNHTWNCC